MYLFDSRLDRVLVTVVLVVLLDGMAAESAAPARKPFRSPAPKSAAKRETKPASEQCRIWRITDPKSSVEALLLGVENDTAQLKTKNNKLVRVPTKNLSLFDQALLPGLLGDQLAAIAPETELPVGSVFSSKKGLVYLAGGDGAIRSWDLARRTSVNVFRGHTSRPHLLVLSKDEEKMLSVAGRGDIRIWNTAQGTEISAVNRDGCLTEWPIPTLLDPSASYSPEQRAAQIYTRSRVTCAAFTPKGEGFAYGIVNFPFRVVDDKGSSFHAWGNGIVWYGPEFSPNVPWESGLRQECSGSNLPICPPLELMFTVYGDCLLRCKHCLHLWRNECINSRSPDPTIILNKRAENLGTNPTCMALGLIGMALWYERDRNGQLKSEELGSGRGINSGGSFPVAYANGDGSMHVRILTRSFVCCHYVSEERGGKVSQTVFSPEGSRVVGVCDDGVKIWDWLQLHRIATKSGIDRRNEKEWPMRASLVLENMKEALSAVAFSPDGKRLLGVRDKNVRIWDAVNGKELLSLEDAARPIINAAFSSDGTQVFAVLDSGKLKIWNVVTAESAPTAQSGSK